MQSIYLIQGLIPIEIESAMPISVHKKVAKLWVKLEKIKSWISFEHYITIQ
jgi:hypothetical protein